MTLLTIPGAVDPHVHLRDLEWSHKATVESETAAALAGGYWAVLDMPNTPPVTTTRSRLDEKAARFGSLARCDVGLYLGAGAEADEVEYALASPAAVGLKMYCDATTGDLTVSDQSARLRHLLAWQRAGSRKPVAVHAEGASVAEVLALVRRVDVHVHFCHVAGADEVGLLREAKREGLRISVGVTPHHLYLTDDDAARLGGFGRVRPPLGSRADVEALWQAISDGVVDVIESDHAPHTRAEKASAEPPSGLPGLETTLPLMALAVQERRLAPGRLIELLATSAQRIFGLRPPPETATIVDLEASWVIDERELRTSPRWSPFDGLRVRGRVREVRIRGRVAYDGESVLSEPGQGRSVAWS